MQQQQQQQASHPATAGSDGTSATGLMNPNITIGGIDLDETGVVMLNDNGFTYRPTPAAGTATPNVMEENLDTTRLLPLASLLPKHMRKSDNADRMISVKGTVQFIMMHRSAAAPQQEWSLTPRNIFENAMTAIQNRNTELKNGANIAIVYASVSAGVPIIGFRPSMILQIDTFREQTEQLTLMGFNFQIMPKASLLRRYALTIMLWQPMRHLSLDLIPLQLFERTPALAGGMRITKCKTFKKEDKDKQQRSMDGVRLIQIAGDQDFLRSLYQFPRNHRFGLGLGSIIIRGGDRIQEQPRHPGYAAAAASGRGQGPSRRREGEFRIPNAPRVQQDNPRGRGRTEAARGPERQEPQISQAAALSLINQSQDQVMDEAISGALGAGRGRGTGRGGGQTPRPLPPGHRPGSHGATGAGSGP